MPQRTTPTTGEPFSQELYLANTGELPQTTTLGIFYAVNAGERWDAFFATEDGGHSYAHLSFLVDPIANPDAQGTPQPVWTVGGTDAGHEPHPERRP